tara:strand:- start:121 stop:285 length:165 start_codon:yes stop_codon:yes gene_type:complete
MIIELLSYTIECTIIETGGFGEITTVLLTTSGTGSGIGAGGEPAQLKSINILNK